MRLALEEESHDLWEAALDVIEPIRHNVGNEVTGGVWRVASGERRAVVKVMRPGASESALGWPAGADPRHWNWWRREADWYESGLGDRWLPPAGIRVPRVLASYRRADGSVSLWLEDVRGRPGVEWSTEEIADLGRRWARVQATVGGPAPRWLARRWVSEYLAHRPDDSTAFDDDASWDRTPLGRHLEEHRVALGRLWRDRERFVSILERLPQVVSHHDLWPMNAIRPAGGVDDRGAAVVLVDWAFVGVGPVGHDAANLILDTFLDLLVDETRLDEVAQSVTEAYLDGFGGHVDERLVRLGIWASAVKFAWLPMRMASGAVPGYSTERDPDELARRRAPVFALMWQWSELARREATRLGWW